MAAFANIQLTDTFQTWLTRTNEVVSRLNTVTVLGNTVTVNTAVSNTVFVQGSAVFSGTATFANTSTTTLGALSNLRVSGGTTGNYIRVLNGASGTLEYVTPALTELSGTISNSQFPTSTTVDGNLWTMDSNTVFNGTVSFNGAATFAVAAPASFYGTATFANTATFNRPTTFANTTIINGNTTFGGTTTTLGALSSLRVSGGVTGNFIRVLNGAGETLEYANLVSSDVNMSTARLLGRTTAGTGAVEEITVGEGLTLSAGTLSASGSALTTTSGSTGLTLTSSSNPVQDITQTAAGQNVTLPDATTMSEGYEYTIINNSSATYDFYILDDGGNFLCGLAPGQVLKIILRDNATANGVWDLMPQFDRTGFIISRDGLSTTLANQTLVGSAGKGFVSVALSTTKILHVFNDDDDNDRPVAIVTDLSGTTPTPGSEYTIDTTGNTTIQWSLCKVSATQAVLYYATSATSTWAVVLDVSGTVVTPGTAVAVESSDTIDPDGAALELVTSSLLFLMYPNLTSTGVYARTISLSGSSLTVNAAVELEPASTPYVLACRAIDSTHVLCVYNTTGSGEPRCQVAEISGTTVIDNTTTTVGEGLTAAIAVRLLSPTKFAIVGIENAFDNISVSFASISGTTITPESTIGVHMLYQPNAEMFLWLSNTKFMCIVQTGTATDSYIANIWEVTESADNGGPARLSLIGMSKIGPDYLNSSGTAFAARGNDNTDSRYAGGGIISFLSSDTADDDINLITAEVPQW